MIRRKLSIGLAVVAVALLVSAVRADEPAKGSGHHGGRGTFVSASGGKLVVNNKTSGDKTLDMSDKVTVTVDKKPAKMEDLAKGDKISYKLGEDGKVVSINKRTDAAAPPAPGKSNSK